MWKWVNKSQFCSKIKVVFRSCLTVRLFQRSISRPVVLQMRLLLACLSPGPTLILQLRVRTLLPIVCRRGEGGSWYVGICPDENLTVFWVCLSIYLSIQGCVLSPMLFNLFENELPVGTTII